MGTPTVNRGLPDPRQPGAKPKIIAAIPCLDEERCIGSVVLKTKKFVNSVIVIDGGSADATAEVATEAGATVYQQGGDRGYGAAVRSALQRGSQLQADILIMLDGDGQHDPGDIPRLVKPLLDGEADVVIGSRFLGEAKRPPLYRRIGHRVLNIVTNAGSGQRTSDSQSGFRAYSSKALKQLSLAENGMSVSSEMQFAISKAGLKIAEVPIHVSYTDKAKRNPVGQGLSVLSRVLVLFSLRQPLPMFGLPGLALLAAGLVIGSRVLAIYSDSHQLAIGNALGAVLLCIAGLLGLVVALMLQAMKELMRGSSGQE